MRLSLMLTPLPFAALLGALCTEDPVGAQPPIAVEFLTPMPGAQFTDKVAVQVRNQFPGRGTDVINLTDASNVVVAKITIQPKARFPWHTHPGPVLITIAEGDFVYMLAADCLERYYSAGNGLIDAGFDNVHTAFNPSSSKATVVIATFLGIPAGSPVTIPVPGPDPLICPLPTP